MSDMWNPANPTGYVNLMSPYSVYSTNKDNECGETSKEVPISSGHCIVYNGDKYNPETPCYVSAEAGVGSLLVLLLVFAVFCIQTR